MKRSLTDNRDMTVEEIVSLMVYRPYGETLMVMVDDEERIHIKGETWMCILDHKTGDFSFSGELHKYYECDTIVSIRDCFGDLYSVFNVRWDRIERNVWMEVDKEELDAPGRKRRNSSEGDRVSSERVLQYKRDYYWAHREEIRRRRNKKMHK